MFTELCAHKAPGGIDAAVFDFDGTLSKLRAGWETVMAPLMCEVLPGERGEVAATVAAYIDGSTGIQTIHQMRWLAEQVTKRGGAALDPWEYKAEYNRRLMQTVARRRDDVAAGREDRARYIVAGADAFLSALVSMGVHLYAASGTDDGDVKKEAAVLGFDRYFEEIRGASPDSDCCSKEAVLGKLIAPGRRVLVVGDGKVEIALGREVGALTLGVAANDVIGKNDGAFDPRKFGRLQNAGAHAITADFTNTEELLGWLK